MAARYRTDIRAESADRSRWRSGDGEEPLPARLSIILPALFFDSGYIILRPLSRILARPAETRKDDDGAGRAVSDETRRRISALNREVSAAINPPPLHNRGHLFGYLADPKKD